MSIKEMKTKEDFLKYLKKINFKKHLKKIEKKLNNKKIVIYGAGVFFEALCENYDLSKLNIVAISDKKFETHKECEKAFGYTVCAPCEMVNFNPDYVLVGTIKFVNIIESLENSYLKDVNCIVKPLINKPILELIKEIWD